MAQGELLGNKLADDDGKERDEADHDTKPEGFGNSGRDPVRGQNLRQASTQGRARKGAGEDAHEGDADLDRREEASGILHQLQGDFRARTAFFSHGLETGTAGGNDGEFR